MESLRLPFGAMKKTAIGEEKNAGVYSFLLRRASSAALGEQKTIYCRCVEKMPSALREKGNLRKPNASFRDFYLQSKKEKRKAKSPESQQRKKIGISLSSIAKSPSNSRWKPKSGKPIAIRRKARGSSVGKLSKITLLSLISKQFESRKETMSSVNHRQAE